MANKHRGEVDITIAGKTYTVAMTLEALAQAAEALGVETLADDEDRIKALRIPDMKPLLAALVAGNGHQVPAADIGAMGYKAYMAAIIAIWNARPDVDEKGEAEAPAASPRKRAA